MLAAVSLALFGLLSMHGWGSHAGGHTTAMPTADGAVAMESAPITGHDHRTMTAEGSAVGTQEKPDGDPGTSLLSMCLAVLAGFLLGIALLLAVRGIRIPRWLLPTWPHPVFAGRDRDPPDLLQLSVIRC